MQSNVHCKTTPGDDALSGYEILPPRCTHHDMKFKILTGICASIAVLLGVASYWLFYLTDGHYAISKPDGSILYVFSAPKGWFIFVADLLIALLLLWAAYAFFRRSRRQAAR